MKKVLLSLLAVAALVLSCQNYDDEFAALNTKIASLESQITSLAELRTAVTGVQSSISSLQTAVAAAQAAAEAADNADAISALATSVAAIAADLVDLQTAIDGATTEADLDALKEELNTTLAALQSLIETNSSSIASLVSSNTDLQAALDALGLDVTSILASNATFEGNLKITNAAELAYAKSLGNKVVTIKGNVYVEVDEFAHTSGGTGDGLKAEEVNEILSQITYVVGNLKLNTDVSLDLSSLTTISGDYSVVGHDVSDDALVSVGGDVLFDHDGAYVSKIETARNIFLVPYGIAKATTSAVAKVGTTSIDFMAITKATGIQTVTASEVAAHTSGSSSVTAHTSGASFSFGSTEADQTISLPSSVAAASATSVKIGQVPVVSVSGGAVLSTVELHYAADYDAKTNTSGSDALDSVSVSGEGLSSVTVMAKTITGSVTISATKTGATALATANFPNLEVAGAITSDAATTSLPKLESAGGISLSHDVSVSLPELVSSTGDVILTRATSFSAPKLARVAAKIATGDTEADTAGAAITANLVSGDVSFPLLTKAGDVSFDLATSFVAPDAKISSINLEEAEIETSATGAVTVVVGVTLEVKSVSSQPLNATTPGDDTPLWFKDSSAAGITTLILHGQDAVLDLTDFTKATSITYNGAADSNGDAASNTLTVGSANTSLSTLTLGGVIGTVEVDMAQATGSEGINTSTNLTTITTSGTIESLTVQNNFDLTTLNALHTDSTTNSIASILVVQDNPNLTTLKTGITTFSDVTILNNYKLSNLDLSSITSLPQNWSATNAINLDIKNNFIDTADTSADTGDADYLTIYGLGADDASDEDNDDPLSTYIGMTGSYQAESSVSAEKYMQSGLATLSTFFDGLEERFRGTNAASRDSQGITIDLDYKWENSSNALQTASFDVDGTDDSLIGDDSASIFADLIKIQ